MFDPTFYKAVVYVVYVTLNFSEGHYFLFQYFQLQVLITKMLYLQKQIFVETIQISIEFLMQFIILTADITTNYKMF